MPAENGYTEGKADFKAGKLIRVKAKFQGKKIIEIEINGDFYIYPEDSIEKIENALKGKSIEDAKKIINEIMEGAEGIGIDADSLILAVEEAWRRRK
jgi:lipoate-protein ligase A